MIDLSAVLNKGIAIIRKDVIDGILRRTQLNGRRYVNNAKSTIRDKGFDHRLVGPNKTFITASNYGIKEATSKNQVASITVPSGDIALYNQAPTGNGTIPKSSAAVFWGISDKMEKEIMGVADAEINKQIDREIERAGFKKI